MPLPITAITVSLEVKRMEFGSGRGRFIALKAESSPDSGITLDEALRQSLELHHKAWESVLTAEVVAKDITSDEYNTQRELVNTRFKKIKALFQEHE